MLAAFVPAGLPSSAAPAAPALRGFGPAAGRAGESSIPSPLLVAGVPLAAAGAVGLARGQRRQRSGRVAVAAGWKPDPERIGATLPLADPKDGVMMWDPLGFCKDGSQETFDKYRAAEVKHGRVAMVAVVGLVTQHYVHIKNFVTTDKLISMDGMPNGFGALSTEPGGQGFGLLVMLAGLIEMGVLKSPKGSKPWEFGDPAGWRQQIDYLGWDDDMLKTYEIEHGRLAMFGVMGALAAEYVTGYDAVDQWAYWKDSLTAFNGMNA